MKLLLETFVKSWFGGLSVQKLVRFGGGVGAVGGPLWGLQSVSLPIAAVGDNAPADNLPHKR